MLPCWYKYRTGEYLTVQLDTSENIVDERDNYPYYNANNRIIIPN
tara:strand:+ start:817 stop:951 length:135 start_codon:yes stop_codon:yes gene_type:complete